MDIITMYSKTVYMSNRDAGISLNRRATSTMTRWHHFNSTSDPDHHNLSQVGWVYLSKAATICLWTAYQCSQTLCICLVWMQEAVWIGWQPQPWRNDIILCWKEITHPSPLDPVVSSVTWVSFQQNLPEGFLGNLEVVNAVKHHIYFISKWNCKV